MSRTVLESVTCENCGKRADVHAEGDQHNRNREVLSQSGFSRGFTSGGWRCHDCWKRHERDRHNEWVAEYHPGVRCPCSECDDARTSWWERVLPNYPLNPAKLAGAKASWRKLKRERVPESRQFS